MSVLRLHFHRVRHGACLLGTTLLLSAAGVAGLPTLAQADQADIAAARQLATTGIEAYERKDYSAAVDLLTRAERLVHAPTHLLYLARAHVALHHPVDAFELYNQIVRERLADTAPAVFHDAQAQARTEMEGLKAKFSFMTLSLQGKELDEVEVQLDGRALAPALLGVKVPINPGAHHVTVLRDGNVEQEREFVVESTKDITIELTVRSGPAAAAGLTSPAHDTAPAERRPVLPYVALGVGGAGIVVGGVFTALHFVEKGKANRRFEDENCATQCFESDQAYIDDHDRKAATFGTVGWIGWGVGAAGLATGVTLLLLQRDRDATSDKVSVQPVIGWGYLGASGRF